MLICDIRIYLEKLIKSLTLSLFSLPLSKYSIAFGLPLTGSMFDRYDLDAYELIDRLSSTFTRALGC
jgi:hypothetical protein